MNTREKIKALRDYAKVQTAKHRVIAEFRVVEKFDTADKLACYTNQDWTITFSKEAIKEYSIETLRDIYLHELAHAINGTYKIEGDEIIKKQAHGKEFQQVCKQIGCKSLKARNSYRFFEDFGTFNPSKEQILEYYTKITA
jgi:predicted SprT family Zn-dependent metalloprotease